MARTRRPLRRCSDPQVGQRCGGGGAGLGRGPQSITTRHPHSPAVGERGEVATDLDEDRQTPAQRGPHRGVRGSPQRARGQGDGEGIGGIDVGGHGPAVAVGECGSSLSLPHRRHPERTVLATGSDAEGCGVPGPGVLAHYRPRRPGDGVAHGCALPYPTPAPAGRILVIVSDDRPAQRHRRPCPLRVGVPPDTESKPRTRRGCEVHRRRCCPAPGEVSGDDSSTAPTAAEAGD